MGAIPNPLSDEPPDVLTPPRSSFSDSKHLGLTTGGCRVDVVITELSSARGLSMGFASPPLLTSDIILFDRLGSSGAIMTELCEMVSEKSVTLVEIVLRLACDCLNSDVELPCMLTLANTENSCAEEEDE